MNLLTLIRDRLSGNTPSREVRFDSGGFSVVPNRKPAIRVLWARVQEVSAFKQDQFSSDQICLGFRSADLDSEVWIGEDDNGFRAFRTEVERRFPEIDRGWFAKVAQPPFGENRTMLWPRA